VSTIITIIDPETGKPPIDRVAQDDIKNSLSFARTSFKKLTELFSTL